MANLDNHKPGLPANSSQAFKSLHQEIQKRVEVKGITPIDMLSLPSPLSGVFDRIMRRGLMTVMEMADELKVTRDEARYLVDLLVSKGYLRSVDNIVHNDAAYQIRFAIKRKRKLPSSIWKSLDED